MRDPNRMRIPRVAWVCGFLLSLPAISSGADGLPGQAIRPVRRGKGERVRVEVARDTWVSSVGAERVFNLGGSTRLKTKSHQEFTLLDIDPSALRGRVIESAALHLFPVGKAVQRRLTVSTLAAPWTEGTSPRYARQTGSATFLFAEQDRRPWAWPGSDITAVMNGLGNTLWRFADATPPDANGWQRVAVDPQVIAARVAGISHGFVLFDDVGSEYTRSGDKFTYHHMPNRFVASRHGNVKMRPYFTVRLGATDRSAPRAVRTLRADPADAADLPADEALVKWVTPEDVGPAGTIGFQVRFARGNAFRWETATPVPRYMIPLAGRPGDEVRLHLRGVGLRPGTPVTVGVRPVDGAGNVGPESTVRLPLSRTPRQVTIPDVSIRPFTAPARIPILDGVGVAIIDPLDKVSPVSGKMIPPRGPAYLQANHLWSAKRGRIRLFAARNEFVAFQILLKGDVEGLSVNAWFDNGENAPAPTARLFQFRHVETKAGPLPDPLAPVSPGAALRRAGGAKGHGFTALLVDVYVPHDGGTPKGGRLVLRRGTKRLEIPIDLTVWNFTLPDTLSFVPQMNCYGLPAPPVEVEYYRLAHEHRTCLNRLGYNWRGRPNDGCAPRVDEKSKRLIWDAYDRRFGPLLDGTAFADLPRKGIPVDSFYLPMNENWPMDIHRDFQGGYWVEHAFAPRYRRRLVDTARQFTEHVKAKGWTGTFFEFYLNNKVYFKRTRGSWYGSSAPWILDEPSHTQDFWALRWYGIAFHEGVAQAGPDGVKMAYRCDISRPQWQRDLLDGVMDVNICGGTFRTYLRTVLDRKRRHGEITYNYGSSNNIEDSNVQPAGWCLDTWCLGGDGVLPWQTVGKPDSWRNADPLSLFYPGGPAGQRGPVPSIRLKSYRRGQQDVEYLVQLAETLKQPRWALGRRVREILNLKADVDQKGEEAGRVSYRQLDPAALWALRVRVGAMLDKAKPAPRRARVEMRTPPRDVARLPKPGYVRSVAPDMPVPAATRPAAVPAVKGRTVTKTVRGAPHVADAVIDFNDPDRNFGRVRRDNRLLRQKRTNAMLIRFALPKLPNGTTVAQATMSLFVWDPSSRAPIRVAAHRMTRPWDEKTVTWNRAGGGRRWKGSAFAVGGDTAVKPESEIIVQPDKDGDVADPPIEIRFDVTSAVRQWLRDAGSNHGIAVVPVIDRNVDDGHWGRFQVLATEYGGNNTPKLSVQYTVP